MKKTLNTKLGIISLLVTASTSAFAQTLPSSKTLTKVNVYHELTANEAAKHNIDLNGLKAVLNLKANEILIFKVEEDGDLDLSIYESPLFNSMRVDGIIQ